jgi:UDP-2,3-diacylglucosamine pyrophosphatase LpxH
VKNILRVKTLILSDVHLGTVDSKAEQAAHVIRHTSCEKLILNGDIIDAWALQRNGRWLPSHTRFVRTVLRKLEKDRIKVVYLRGNHDDVLTKLMPLRLDNLSIVNEHIHQTPAGPYLVVHGDGFDHVSVHFTWLAKLGAVGYDILLTLNRYYGKVRAWLGQEPFSLSAWVKRKVKQAVAFTGRYEKQLQQLAAAKGCVGIICGHIHTPANRQVDRVHYLNSGDWVESLTAIVEHLDGNMEILTYAQFCQMTGRRPKGEFSMIDLPKMLMPGTTAQAA